jgi:serine/threonine protein kinase
MSANNNNNSTSSLCSFTTEVLQDSQSVSSSTTLGLAPRIQDFDILKPISRGAFGKVFLCHRRDHPERKLAVKVLKKHEVIEKNLVSQVIAERNALAITKSPFCVNLLYCLQTHNNVFLVSDIYLYLTVIVYVNNPVI